MMFKCKLGKLWGTVLMKRSTCRQAGWTSWCIEPMSFSVSDDIRPKRDNHHTFSNQSKYISKSNRTIFGKTIFNRTIFNMTIFALDRHFEMTVFGNKNVGRTNFDRTIFNCIIFFTAIIGMAIFGRTVFNCTIFFRTIFNSTNLCR